MLKVDHLFKSYKTGKIRYEVLKDVCFEVEEGEFVAVMGASGSGKTTMLNCISCFYPYDQGEITLNGICLSRLSEEEIARVRNEQIGFVFQDFMLLDVLNKLRKYNKGNYRQFSLCFSLSVLLMSALTLFMLSPFVQSRLPIGGDSRKMLYMIYAVAVTGCVLFTIYATGLFLRFKSREVGILIALGTSKGMLSKTIRKEMLMLIGKLSVAGILAGGLTAVGFGRLYEHMVQSVEGDRFGLSLSGLLSSVLFILAVSVLIMGMANRFMKRVNLIEILNEERRAEPVRREVGRKYLVTSLILIVLGILGGLIIPFIISTVFKMTLRGFTYAFYILVLVGLYRLMVYSVAIHKRGKNPKKYYKHLISFGMLKFQGVSVVRNMLIITLLLAGALFAIFYSATNYILNDEDFAGLKEGLSKRFQVTQVLFDVSEEGEIYAFSKELYAQYCNSASDSMRVMAAYDEYRAGADGNYGDGEPIMLYPKRPEIEVDWKYNPVFVPLLERNFLLAYTTLLLIFIFVSVICLVSAGVIGYTRSITVAVKSKRVLMDVKKLGARQEYLNQILKEQVKKVFVLPTAAALLMFAYYTLILWQNDGAITTNEYLMVAFNAGACAVLFICQYILYLCSLKKAAQMAFD